MGERLRRFLHDGTLLVVVVAVALVAVWGATRRAGRVVVKLGPNDRDYVSGFREEFELDGHTRFRWTGLTAAVRAPVRLSGDGWSLRMRVRRHYDDPAVVRLQVERQTVGELEIRADRKVAYPIQELSLPRLSGREPFRLDLQFRVKNPEPRGMAMDWVELERAGGDARIHLTGATWLRMGGLIAIILLALRLAGAPRRLAAAGAGGAIVALGLGLASDVVAAERIVRLGWPVVLTVGLTVAGLLRSRRVRRALGLDVPAVTAGLLALLVLAALAVRLVVVLHPQFYYPDVRIHGLVLWRLDRLGLSEFLRQFHEIQFRYSLGLQIVKERWYAMPYPPALYVFAWPLARWLGYAYETAVSLLPAAVNALEVLVVFGIGRRLGLSPWASSAAGGVHVLLPLFLVRLSLGYFPALVGHFFDALFVFLLIAALARLGQPRVVLALGGLLAATLLTYTQSLLNFGLLIALVLLVELIADRTPGAWRRQLGLASAGILGVVLSIVIFYGRYVPAVVQMSRGEAMAGVEIKEEVDRQRAKYAAAALPDEDDPDSGPGLNPWRGLRKAGRRLFIFYSGFAPLVLLGLVLVTQRLDGPLRRFVWVWAGLYLTLNLASGGLPGPNLVRYNKDLEIVAPLFCLALGRVVEWAWLLSRPLGGLLAVTYLVFGALRAWAALVGRFVFER